MKSAIPTARAASLMRALALFTVCCTAVALVSSCGGSLSSRASSGSGSGSGGGSGSGSGGSGGGGTGGGFTVGGSVAGLVGTQTAILQNNGGNNDAITANDVFTFSSGLATGASYAVSVLTQPAGGNCAVTGASGTVASVNVVTVAVNCTPITYTWESGSSSANAVGNYGSLGVSVPANAPGARTLASTWTDSTGNLWLFGGTGCDSRTVACTTSLNDLWKYTPGTTPSASSWTWMGGSNISGRATTIGTLGVASTTANPGARQGAASWSDTSGNLWLFGGYGYDSSGNLGSLNDLWSYNPTAGTWTWVSGASTAGAAGVYGSTPGASTTNGTPGARSGAVSWIDVSGNLWLFGGHGCDATTSCTGTTGVWLNDLWKFAPGATAGTGTWTWVAGSSTGNAAGSYGTQGTLASTNAPGGRQYATAHADAAGNVWLFGGYGCDATASCAGPNVLNDLWKYTPGTGWTWVAGSSTANVSGVYGVLGTAAAGNVPGARSGATLWTDASGSVWLFGGNALVGTSTVYYNDVWEFSPLTSHWTWVTGASSANTAGVYGTKGIASGTAALGARTGQALWLDSSSNPWFFGGTGCDVSTSCTNLGVLNDLWKFVP